MNSYPVVLNMSQGTSLERTLSGHTQVKDACILCYTQDTAQALTMILLTRDHQIT